MTMAGSPPSPESEEHTLDKNSDPDAGRQVNANGAVSEKLNVGDEEVQKKLEQLFHDQFAEVFNGT